MSLYLGILNLYKYMFLICFPIVKLDILLEKIRMSSSMTVYI